ncbi:MAG: hypothetical protein AAFV19_11355 [Pseudomonadota bacterium]
MSDLDDEQDLDGVDGRSFVAWLIYTGAGSAIAYMPWTFADAFYDALEQPPLPPIGNEVDDLVQFVAIEFMKPMIPVGISALVCGIAAAILVFAAKSGHRLHALMVLLLGAVLGALTALVMGSGEFEDLIFGAASGLAAAGGVALIRRLVIRGG